MRIIKTPLCDSLVLCVVKRKWRGRRCSNRLLPFSESSLTFCGISSSQLFIGLLHFCNEKGKDLRIRLGKGLIEVWWGGKYSSQGQWVVLDKWIGLGGVGWGFIWWVLMKVQKGKIRQFQGLWMCNQVRWRDWFNWLGCCCVAECNAVDCFNRLGCWCVAESDEAEMTCFIDGWIRCAVHPGND